MATTFKLDSNRLHLNRLNFNQVVHSFNTFIKLYIFLNRFWFYLREVFQKSQFKVVRLLKIGKLRNKSGFFSYLMTLCTKIWWVLRLFENGIWKCGYIDRPLGPECVPSLYLTKTIVTNTSNSISSLGNNSQIYLTYYCI